MRYLVLIICVVLIVLTIGCTTQSPQPPSNQKATAAEAQESTQNLLRSLFSNESGEAFGVDLPTDFQVGNAVLIIKEGISVWDVPVYLNGKKIGDSYVKQERGVDGKLEGSYELNLTAGRLNS